VDLEAAVTTGNLCMLDSKDGWVKLGIVGAFKVAARSINGGIDCNIDLGVAVGSLVALTGTFGCLNYFVVDIAAADYCY